MLLPGQHSRQRAARDGDARTEGFTSDNKEKKFFRMQLNTVCSFEIHP